MNLNKILNCTGCVTTKRLLSIVLLLPLNTFGSTLYVSDNLRVGIRPAPEANTASLVVVSTGTKLELIEKKGRYIKVRSPSGIEGWIKGAYLSTKKPSSIILKQAQSKIKKLEKEISSLSKNTSDERLAQNLDSPLITRLQAEKTQLHQQIEKLKMSPERIESSAQENPKFAINLNFLNNEVIAIIFGSLAFLVSLGFLFGVSWHKRQVTKRLGGLSL